MNIRRLILLTALFVLTGCSAHAQGGLPTDSAAPKEADRLFKEQNSAEARIAYDAATTRLPDWHTPAMRRAVVRLCFPEDQYPRACKRGNTDGFPAVAFVRRTPVATCPELIHLCTRSPVRAKQPGLSQQAGASTTMLAADQPHSCQDRHLTFGLVMRSMATATATGVGVSESSAASSINGNAND